jgi:fructan beta-fructosidase
LTVNEKSNVGDTHMIGWMNNWQYAGAAPTSPWRGAMTLPRSLGLRNSPSGLRLTQTPVKALRSLRNEGLEYHGASVAALNRKFAAWPYRSQTFEVIAEIRPGAAKQVVWKILEGPDEYTLVGFDAVAKQLFVDRTRSANTAFSPRFSSKTTAPLDPGNDPLTLHIFVDRSSVEVFSDNGRVVLTNLVFPKPDSIGISLATRGGKPDDIRVSLWKLGSIWTAGTERKTP